MADIVLGPGQNIWLYYDAGREAWTSFVTGHTSGGLSGGLSASGNESITGQWTFSGIDRLGLNLLDTNESHALGIVVGSDLTAARALTLTTGDASRTVTISGNTTISQDYSTAGSPQFTGLTLSGLTTGSVLYAGASGVITQQNAEFFFRMSASSQPQLGIGTTSPMRDASFAGMEIYDASTSIFEVTGDSTVQMEFRRYSTDASQPSFLLCKGRGTKASPTVVSSGDVCGAVLFQGVDVNGSAVGIQAARIDGVVDGTPGTNDMPGRLVIATTADGASSTTEAMRVNNQQIVFIGNAEAYPSTGSKALIFGDGTAPTGMGTNTAGLYANDVAGTVEMFAIDEGAASTQISPHNFELFTPDPQEPYPWSYYSRHPYLGVEVGVDLAKLCRLVEQLTGQQLIHQRPVPIRDWADDQEAGMRRQMAVWDQERQPDAPLPPQPVIKDPPAWVAQRLGARLNTAKLDALRAELAAWRPTQAPAE